MRNRSQLSFQQPKSCLNYDCSWACSTGAINRSTVGRHCCCVGRKVAPGDEWDGGCDHKHMASGDLGCLEKCQGREYVPSIIQRAICVHHHNNITVSGCTYRLESPLPSVCDLWAQVTCRLSLSQGAGRIETESHWAKPRLSLMWGL